MRKHVFLALFAGVVAGVLGTAALAPAETLSSARSLDASRPHVQAGFQAVRGFDLQAALDAAKPGDVVDVPAGVYEGVVNLREGVTLLGAGPEKTVLRNGPDAPVVVGAKNAMLVGFTIEGGRIGVECTGDYMGIFQNVIRNNREMGIHVVGGSAVIANNLITGNQGLGAIAVNSANPFILNNTIVNNAGNGVWAWYAPGPVLMNNVFRGNTQSVMAGAGAEVKSAFNALDTPAAVNGTVTPAGENFPVAVTFEDASTGDFRLKSEGGRIDGTLVRGFTNSLNPNGDLGIAFSGTPDLATYRSLMTTLLEEAVYLQPSVRYDLTEDIGLFGVTTRFDRANFTVRSSTPNTVISDSIAYDRTTEFLLNVEPIREGDFSAVAVRNNQTEGQERDRYVLDNVFFHPGSYAYSDNGNLVFERETGFSRIEVLLPEGYRPVSVNQPATFAWEGHRVMVRVNGTGMTTVKVEMAHDLPTKHDVFGLGSQE